MQEAKMVKLNRDEKAVKKVSFKEDLEQVDISDEIDMDDNIIETHYDDDEDFVF